MKKLNEQHKIKYQVTGIETRKVGHQVFFPFLFLLSAFVGLVFILAFKEALDSRAVQDYIEILVFIAIIALALKFIYKWLWR